MKACKMYIYITFLFKTKVFHGYVLPRLNGIYNSPSGFLSSIVGACFFGMKFCFLGGVRRVSFQRSQRSCGEIPTEGHPKQSQTHTLCYMSPLNITKLGWCFWEPWIYSRFFRVMFSSLCRKGTWTTQTLKSGWDISSYSQFSVLLPVLKTINNFNHLTPSTNPVLLLPCFFFAFQAFLTRHATQGEVPCIGEPWLSVLVMDVGCNKALGWTWLGPACKSSFI